MIEKRLILKSTLLHSPYSNNRKSIVVDKLNQNGSGFKRIVQITEEFYSSKHLTLSNSKHGINIRWTFNDKYFTLTSNPDDSITSGFGKLHFSKDIRMSKHLVERVGRYSLNDRK